MFMASFLLACVLAGFAFAEATLGNHRAAVVWLVGAVLMVALHLGSVWLERRRWNRRGVRR